MGNVLPLDVVVVGEALNDVGFVAFDAVKGLGLNTFGFLWPCDGIWAPQQFAITTTWTSIQTNPNITTETCTD